MHPLCCGVHHAQPKHLISMMTISPLGPRPAQQEQHTLRAFDIWLLFRWRLTAHYFFRTASCCTSRAAAPGSWASSTKRDSAFQYPRGLYLNLSLCARQAPTLYYTSTSKLLPTTSFFCECECSWVSLRQLPGRHVAWYLVNGVLAPNKYVTNVQNVENIQDVFDLLFETSRTYIRELLLCF